MNDLGGLATFGGMEIRCRVVVRIEFIGVDVTGGGYRRGSSIKLFISSPFDGLSRINPSKPMGNCAPSA